MIYTTLNKIHSHSPYAEGWAKLLTYLGKTQADDEPLALVDILKSNGLEDTLWCLRTIPEHAKESRLFAVACAREGQHLMTDPRSLNALDVAERYAHGQATEFERAVAWAAAFDAVFAAAGAKKAAAWAAVAAAAGGSAWAAAVDAAGAAAQEKEFIRIFG